MKFSSISMEKLQASNRVLRFNDRCCKQTTCQGFLTSQRLNFSCSLLSENTAIWPFATQHNITFQIPSFDSGITLEICWPAVSRISIFFSNGLQPTSIWNFFPIEKSIFCRFFRRTPVVGVTKSRDIVLLCRRHLSFKVINFFQSLVLHSMKHFSATSIESSRQMSMPMSRLIAFSSSSWWSFKSSKI